MATFVTTGKFTESAIQGLVSKPEDRTAMVAGLVEAAGGKLLNYYLTTGAHDFLIITEADDGEAAVAAVMAAAATGTVCNVETSRAWTSGEFAGIAEKAGKLSGHYRAPGT